MLLPPLTPARLIRRYKRFLADVELDDGEVITVHCPNSGSMKGCLGARWPVMLSTSDNPKRKYPHTLEMVHNGSCWIGINTARTNGVVEEGIRSGLVPEMAEFDALRREVRLGEKSRIDLVLDRAGQRTWIEVKSVTMVDEHGRFAFPDAVTTRGAKHLRELAGAVFSGDQAAMFYLVQRSDGSGFTVADDIDPAYDNELRRSIDAGVDVFVYRAEVGPEEIRVTESVELEIEPPTLSP
ncbi:MAG: DNA/RNA nuclease SfsA [Thermoanaerobaculales bacterium]|nr:DNA/RNA nuclease SfsA [Thermoanaerobaculales bacterium]